MNEHCFVVLFCWQGLATSASSSMEELGLQAQMPAITSSLCDIHTGVSDQAQAAPHPFTLYSP